MTPGKVWYFDSPNKPWFDQWKFCPICGTPRPVEKSLSEKFMDAPNAFVHINLANDPRIYRLTKESAEKLAQIAEEFYKEKP